MVTYIFQSTHRVVTYCLLQHLFFRMGNTLSQTLYAFLQYFGLYSKQVTIAVIGEKNAKCLF